MKITWYADNDLRNERRLVIEWDKDDDYKLIDALDDMDKALVKECQDSDKISDKLLALETMARRLEEYGERNKLEEEPSK